jgi:protein involved in polysaccharide export with SLBB domain
MIPPMKAKDADNFKDPLRMRGVAVASTVAGGICLLALASCADNGALPPVPAEAYALKSPGVLSTGDEISITFSNMPEMDSRQKIQENGTVSLPAVGEITAAGESVSGLQEYLTTLYQPLYPETMVTVALEKAALFIYVSGEVQNPGKIQLDGEMSVLEAVTEAGGFTRLANTRNVTVVRDPGGKNEQHVLNLNAALEGYQVAPFQLKPFDVIHVKERAW